MKYLKVLTTALLTGSILLASPVSAASFKDVPSTHWANDSINWAVNQGIANGFQDGTFHPEDYVTEEAFVSMFVRAYGEVPEVEDAPYWSYKYYKEIQPLLYPVTGMRDSKVNRKWVAEFISASQGKNYTKDNAIRYVLGKQLAKGKTEATVVGYKGSDLVTRAEAVAMIKNVIEKRESNELLAMPIYPSDVSEIKDVPMGISTDKYTDEEKEEIIDGIRRRFGHDSRLSDPYRSSYRFDGDVLLIGDGKPTDFMLAKARKIADALKDTNELYAMINVESSGIGLNDINKPGSVIMVFRIEDNNSLGYIQYWNLDEGTDLNVKYVDGIVKAMNAFGISVGDTFVKTLKATTWDGKERSFKSGSTRYYITNISLGQGFINANKPWGSK
ncbi:S-layer homology domain-containing protein [Paenibacillus sp. DYY-L-2]|uniref:S-layer homology domain-containing protein n=1 Tax=Paenibacillus sp. DYY-L-2 TaxID=3447013 RepID=UPI003F4F6508